MTDENNTNLLNEKLKQREQEELAERAAKAEEDGEQVVKLDDATRVKVLSPTRLVIKRFLRNKLAIVGLVILITLFVMCFLGPIFYPYGQTQKFQTTTKLHREYAISGELQQYTKYTLDEERTKDVAYYVDTFIGIIDAKGEVDDNVRKTLNVKDINYYEDGDIAAVEFKSGDIYFEMRKLGEKLYMLYISGGKVGELDIMGTVKSGEFSDEVKDALKSAFRRRESSVEVDGVVYEIRDIPGVKDRKTVLAKFDEPEDGILATKLCFDRHDLNSPVDIELEIAALKVLYTTCEFTYNGENYTIDTSSEERLVKNSKGEVVYGISELSTRDYMGQDSLSIEFKTAFAEVVFRMMNATTQDEMHNGSFVFDVPQLDPETGERNVDEDGNLILSTETINVERKNTGEYIAKYDQVTKVYDMYSSPSGKHILGTDGDGYDVFARIMYGGRISLMVGFVVVFLETILGVIMGGIAGFFGGVVDTLIMRLVDIFYCIPTMPIMIIIASVFDKMQVPTYWRLFWMMAILGILGWSGIARLVRGQILSLREQEFMTAAEATGLKTSRRIFKHLVPNVMPQLIVSMTMGLGSVILLESTLSYLGLGVKHPMATWGNMINSVSTIDAMKNYTYIWIPVGVLICLAVIAFNFVGDGLRDAFDPKMKR